MTISLLGVEVVGFILVYRRFCLICRRYPLTVAVDLCRCFLTSSEVKPGQIVKKHALMASIHVEGTGLKVVLWI